MNERFLFDIEQQAKYVIGCDEAGRGPAAGGVFAAAVCFTDRNEELVTGLEKLNDSKKLSAKSREALYDIILNNTVNSIVCVEVEEIEKINILNASLKAMKLVCEKVCSKLPDDGKILTLVDGNKLIKNYTYPQKYVVKGDSKSASVAAASILAKVARDRYMNDLDKKYPMYGWAKNAGYLTSEHLVAIDKYGLCEYHRPSFLTKHFEKQKQLSLF